ncbi:MAG: hypothetical protein ABSD46_07555 [Bacteroidota bacterium]
MSQIKHKGLALIIDEKLGDEGSGDKINEIAKIIKSNKIPYWGCQNTNEAQKYLENISDVSFIVMDWNLIDPNPDITTDENLNAASNVLFLRALKNYCFAPVIILSALDPQDIIHQIQTHDATLYDTNSNRNFILIKRKNNVLNRGQLFRIINKWIENNPSIYTLKTWDSSFYSAKNRSFWSLYEKNPMWPKILWQTFETDMIDESTHIYDAINRMIISRINKHVLNKRNVKSGKAKINIADIKKVIAETMYIENNNILENDLQPGDIFKNGGKYYINIRPECDTVNRFQSVEAIDVYLLECEKIKKRDDWNGRYTKKYGITQKIIDFCIFGIDDENFFRVKYKLITKESYAKIKDKRIRRLISPHVNYLQQGYANYASRVGLPRIPHTVVKEISDKLV